MAAYDDHPSVEACIMDLPARNVSAWCESIGDTEECKELFLTGAVKATSGRRARFGAELDDHAAELLRRFQRENPATDPRDAASGIVACLLVGQLNDRSHILDEAIQEAAARRQGRNTKGGE